MKHTLKEVADHVGGRVVGDASVEVSGVASIASAAAGDLVFVEDEKNLGPALECPASAVIVGESAAPGSASKALLVAVHPKLAFARAARILCDAQKRPPGVHPTAVVPLSAKVGRDAIIEERVVLGAGAAIGARSRVGAGCAVGANVAIGEDCEIYPNVSIYPGTRLGNRVMVHSGAVLGSDGFGYVRDKITGRYEKFPQIGRLEIEDDVEIGANATIDRGALEVTRVGRGTKIDNLVHVGHNVQLGENVIIAAQTGFSGSIVVEDNVVMGGQVGLGEHAHVGEGVMLGGQSGVLPNKVLRGKGIAFWGTPAKPVREYLKELAALARLARKR